MDSSPFGAKVGQVVREIGFDLPELRKTEPDIGQQPNLLQIAKQLEPRVLAGPDHMDVWRKVIVGVDHHAPALEYRQNGWHEGY
jgi:hypothetical protein